MAKTRAFFAIYAIANAGLIIYGLLALWWGAYIKTNNTERTNFDISNLSFFEFCTPA